MSQKEAAQDFCPSFGYRQPLFAGKRRPVEFLANSPLSQIFLGLDANNWAYFIHLVNKQTKTSCDGPSDSAEGRRAPFRVRPASRAEARQGDAPASQGNRQVANFDKRKEELAQSKEELLRVKMRNGKKISTEKYVVRPQPEEIV